MDLNNTYWAQQNLQQNQPFTDPVIQNTIFYPITTTSDTDNTTGLPLQYNQQLFSNIHNPAYQSTINLHSTNQLQQVRMVQQNLPSTSVFNEQRNYLPESTVSIQTKCDKNYLSKTKNSIICSVDLLKKVSNSNELDLLKKVSNSNELEFAQIENENFNEIKKTNDLLVKKVVDEHQSSLPEQQHKAKLGPTCRQEYCRKSKFRFCSNFDEETRQTIFDQFWNKLNLDQRHIFVANRVFRKPIIRRQANRIKESRRTYTLIYTLRNSNGNFEQVCREMFLNTLNISEKQVALWVKKYSIGGDGISKTKEDMLKSMEPGYKKLDDKKEISVKKETCSNTNKINNKNENKSDLQFLPPLINFDGEQYPHFDNNIKSDCVKLDDHSTNLNIQRKSKAKRNHYDPNCPDKPKRKRSMVPNPELWKRNIIKRLRLEGRAYKSGPRGRSIVEDQFVERKAKQLLPTCDSRQCATSSLRHCSTISEWRRQQIFDDFWHKWDWNQKQIFVASMVSRKETKRKKVNNEFTSRRQATLIYYLPNDQGIPVQICRKMFVNTTAVGNSQVLRWIKKYSLGSKIEEQLISQKDATSHASEWLDGLPKVKSMINGEIIYYIDPQFKNLLDFYHTYCDIFKKEQGSNGIVMKKYIFLKMCRIKKIFLMPQNDLDDGNCRICKEHIKKNISNDIWDQHKLKKEKAKLEKIQDSKLAKSNRAIVLLLHLQPIKLVPKLNNSINLYKSKLSCYNFTIHDLKTDFSHCYWFSEDQCGELFNNKSPESLFTSIIYDYITINCLSKKLPIIIYSDGQIDETRNHILSNALLNLSILNGIKIIQKFSESGHSLVEDCFKVNTTFDRYIYIKKKEIYLPSQLAKATREINRSPKLFHGVHLDYEYFHDFSKTEYLRYDSIYPGGYNGSIDSLNEKDICAIKYEMNGIILIKFYFNDEWIELPQKVKDIKPILEYPKLYSGMAEISKTKWDDLQDLKLLIPFDCQPFYDSIKYFED